MKTYLALELKRFMRDRTSVFFISIFPAFLFVIFGVMQDVGDRRIGNGNIAFYIMVGMTAYGVAMATMGVGGQAAVERAQGWGRQLGLTPLRDSQYVAVKTALAMLVALFPIILIYTLGYFTVADADGSVWVISAFVLFAGSIVWALYGLTFGLAFRSEAAVSAASGMLVVLAFLGNIFVPLSGVMLAIAKFTPLYGYVALARYPLTDGELFDSQGETIERESIWLPLVNLGVWALILATLTVLLVRRGRSRQ